MQVFQCSLHYRKMLQVYQMHHHCQSHATLNGERKNNYTAEKPRMKER